MNESSGRDHDDETTASGTAGESQKIEPVSFRDRGHPPQREKWFRWVLWVFLSTLTVLLAGIVWFVFTAKKVVIQVDPVPDRTSLHGGILTPRVGDAYLLRSGEYLFIAQKECYQPLEQRILVSHEPSQTYQLIMQKLPGRLTVHVHQAGDPSAAVEAATLQIDGKEMGSIPLTSAAVEAGKRTVLIQAPNYQSFRKTIPIEGCGKPQAYDFALVPAWATVTVCSDPPDATIRLDGEEVGQTPMDLKVLFGKHELEIDASGYKPWRTHLDITSNTPVYLDDIRLAPADGTLAVTSTPPGAIVTLAERYVGKTPLEIHLSPDTTHTITVTKAGYRTVHKRVHVTSSETKNLDVAMTPVKGIIYLVVEPADAELFVNGRSFGTVRRKLELPAVEHQLEIRKEGHDTFQATVTPSPGFPQELQVVLQDKSSKRPPAQLTASNGYPLQMIQPGRFPMGSSRREQGRRANETLREVSLGRLFYMGVREVSNREFRMFLSQHKSGTFKGKTLDRNEQPVVNVSWEMAAGFCNWLSAKEGLPPAYVKQGETWVPAAALGTGYRLPTEAEWEFCARVSAAGNFTKYPWGNEFPPTPGSGNYSDESAKDIVPNHLNGYDDGYPVSAPPGQFPANELGLVDLGGNVAEWCHDYYSIYPYSADRVYRDPTGPRSGKHHVVKGSSWKHSGISQLRSAFRDYSDDKRPDLGFRICRYPGPQGAAGQ